MTDIEIMHAVFTGPCDGTITLADGTAVDVTPPVVYVDTVEQAKELAALIGEAFEVRGHPYVTEHPFVYDPPEE